MKTIFYLFTFVSLMILQSKSQYSVDSIYDFRSKFPGSSGLFLRTLNIIDNKIFAGISYDASEDYIFVSHNNGLNFEIAARDTSPFIWHKDEYGAVLKIYDFPNRTPFTRMACRAGNDLLIARTKGIISRIDDENNEFINDTIAERSNSFNFIESKENIVITCSENFVFLSEDFGKSWAKISPDINDFGYDGNFYYSIHRKAVLGNNNNIYLHSVIYNSFGLRLNNLFFKSSDKGQNWELISKFDAKSIYINDFIVLQNGTLFIAGFKEYESDRPVFNQYEWLASSTDEGKIWKNLINDSLKTTVTLTRVKFFDDNFGITWGSSYLHYTFDGGVSWDSFYNPDVLGMGLLSAEFINNHSILVGGLRIGNLKKVTFNVNSIKNENSIFSISPNPARDFITISIPEINHIVNSRVDGLVYKIQIFNALGIDLSPALSINEEGGRIDVSNLPAGLYFMKINASNGAYSIMEKFVKL